MRAMASQPAVRLWAAGCRGCRLIQRRMGSDSFYCFSLPVRWEREKSLFEGGCAEVGIDVVEVRAEGLVVEQCR